jgi:hypothetical protein
MIVFVNEESAYRYWVSHHHDAFVLDGRMRPRWSHLMLHRATCPLIKDSSNKRRTHWTTGSRFKACSADREALVAFASEVLGRKKYKSCTQCSPEERQMPAPSVAFHLTHLSALIVDYVLDAAMIRLDDEHRAYHVTVGMIAECMGKSIGQLSAAMSQLVVNGYLEVLGPTNAKGRHAGQQLVFPTALALRTLPFYSQLSDELVQSDLARLRSDDSTSLSGRRATI